MSTQLLERIDMIQEQTMNAELDTLNTMMDAYMKQYMILQECDDPTTFQEAGMIKDGLGNTISATRGVKGESVLKKILLFIPRLLAKAFELIQSFFRKMMNKMRQRKNDKLIDKNGGTYIYYVDIVYTDMMKAGYPDKWWDAVDELIVSSDDGVFSSYTKAVSITTPFVEFLKKYENKDFKMKVPMPENWGYDISARAFNSELIRRLNKIAKNPDIINNMPPEEVQNLQKFRSQLAYICNMFMRLNAAYAEKEKLTQAMIDEMIPASNQNDQDQ